MHSDDVVISVRNVSKVYRLFDHPGDRVKQFATFGMKKYHREFTALRDVSFDVRRGETVGIIGRNGAGKSTLLQIICGILKPTQGTVRMRGRVSALLELGAGFNPEFSGRENVYFQGTLMGLSKARVDERFDDIAAFADIGAFIDQPVRTYSSGMFVRLAFAVAVQFEPDILVVDEALAVGDAGFRARCYRRIAELREAMCTILFVSHDLEQVALVCNRTMLLNDGALVALGESASVVRQCRHFVGGSAECRSRIEGTLGPDSSEQRWSAAVAESIPDEPCDGAGDSSLAVPYAANGAVIEAVRIVSASDEAVAHLCAGVTYRCLFRVRFAEPAFHVRFGILICTIEGARLGGAWSAPRPADALPQVQAGGGADVEFEFRCALHPGRYAINVIAVGSKSGIEYALHGIVGAQAFSVVEGLAGSSIGAVDFDCHATVRATDPEGS